IPTENGILLFEEMEPVFDRFLELKKFTTALASQRTGRLRFASTPAFGLEIVPIALTKFSQQNPDITIEIETLHANEVIKALRANQVDIGLVFDAPKIPGILAKSMGKTGFVCVAPLDISLPSGDRIPLASLEKYPLVTLNDKSVLGRVLNNKLSDTFAGSIDSRFVVETYHLAKRLVKYGAGIAIIDEITAFSGDVSGLQFKAIEPRIDVDISVVTRLNEAMPGHNMQFVNALAESIFRFTSKLN
ncbi:MAG: hypothetical protein EX271_08965, partial [Acidimicrobiales bacterium]